MPIGVENGFYGLLMYFLRSAYCVFNTSNGGLEELDLPSQNFAQQHVGKPARAEAKPLVGEPFLAEHLFDDGVECHGVHHGVNAARWLQAYLYALSLIHI